MRAGSETKHTTAASSHFSTWSLAELKSLTSNDDVISHMGVEWKNSHDWVEDGEMVDHRMGRQWKSDFLESFAVLGCVRLRGL